MQALSTTKAHAPRRSPGPLILGLTALFLGPASAQDSKAPAIESPAAGGQPWLTFPDDPLGRLWASVGAETVPRVEPLAATGGDRWAGWADALGRLDSSPEEHRGALVDLSRFALDDHRAQDAFAWIVRLGAGDPEGLAGSIPTLFPGVGPDVALGPGGRPLPMAEGAVLRPQLPPRSKVARVGSIENRRAEARGLKIGDAVFDMLLKVDGSGVVCDLTHVSGGTAKFKLYLPAPEGFRLKSAYVNWEMQQLPGGADPKVFDWRAMPLTIELAPSEESFTVFARLTRLQVPFPTPPAAGQALPRATAEYGLVLVISDQPTPEPWSAVAGAWSRALGLPVVVQVVGDDLEAARAGGASAPTAIRVDRAPDPIALRRLVTSAIEARIRDSN
jgi:hypothetical protein